MNTIIQQKSKHTDSWWIQQPTQTNYTSEQ